MRRRYNTLRDGIRNICEIQDAKREAKVIWTASKMLMRKLNINIIEEDVH